MRYMIIGAGVAGLAAAEAIRSRDASGEIIMISDDPHGFYSRPGLAFYLSGELPGQQLFPEVQRDWLAANVRYMKGQVSKILPAEHQIEISPKGLLRYDRLLLAVGSVAAPMKTPGSDLESVVKLDDFDDVMQIRSLARKAKSAVVVGGGITALELVEGLTALHVKVHYFLRGKRYWSNVLDEEESDIVEHRLREEGVQIHDHTEISEILGKRGRVDEVVTNKGEKIKCQIVACAVGIKPRMELARSAGLMVDRGIIVNEYMQSDHADIYAAGDIAQVYDPISGNYLLDSLWTPARQQGYAAGLNMAGGNKIYRKEIAFNVTRLAGVTTTIIGMVGGEISDDDMVDIARGDSETFRQLPNAIAMKAGSDVNHVRLLIGDCTLVGALVMGDQTLSRPLKELILEQVDICKVHDKLLDKDSILADVVMDHWSEWRQNGAAE
jgi:3-phenylpropionate/trans-cinnamate dioxygenase ferredoxin reductase subunit